MTNQEVEIYNLLLIFVPFILALLTQYWVSASYNRYSRVSNSKYLTGKEAAENFLRSNGVTDVTVQATGGFLSDHYDPSNKVIRLSSSNYNGKSISSVAVACHEAGHAIQHNQGYALIKVRSMLIVPVQIASQLSWILIILGLILGVMGLFVPGIILFGVILLFQLVTLPVEINASSRANTYLNEYVLTQEEIRGSKAVLRAAAFTYLASIIASLAQILRFVLLFSRRD